MNDETKNLTVEQVKKTHEIIEKYSTDVVDYELATDDVNAALWSNALTALTSGDGSESAGLRDQIDDLMLRLNRSNIRVFELEQKSAGPSASPGEHERFDYKREARKWLNTFMGLDAFGGFCESELIALLKRAAHPSSRDTEAL